MDTYWEDKMLTMNDVGNLYPDKGWQDYDVVSDISKCDVGDIWYIRLPHQRPNGSLYKVKITDMTKFIEKLN